MRHYQEQYVVSDAVTGQDLGEYNWVADPVSAVDIDDVLESAIKEVMHDHDLTEENSTVEYRTSGGSNPHRMVADIYYWNGTHSKAFKEQIIVNEVIVWDDLDLDELSLRAREVYESSDQGFDEFIMDCNNIDELEELLLAYAEEV